MKTKVELRKLAEEIGKRKYDGLTENEIAQKINARTEEAYGDVSNQDVLRELPAMSNPKISNGFVWDIVKAAANYSGQDPLKLAAKDIASRLIFTFETRLPVNMGGESFSALSAAAIQAGFFTQEQLSKLKNLGKTTTSKATLLGLGRVTPDDVAEARKI